METSIQTLRSLPAANLCCFSPLETRGIASPFSGSTSPVAPKPAPLPWLSSPLDSSLDMTPDPVTYPALRLLPYPRRLMKPPRRTSGVSPSAADGGVRLVTLRDRRVRARSDTSMGSLDRRRVERVPCVNPRLGSPCVRCAAPDGAEGVDEMTEVLLDFVTSHLIQHPVQ